MRLKCWGVGALKVFIDKDGMVSVEVQIAGGRVWGCCELECWSGSFAGGSAVVRCAKVGVLSEDGSVEARALWV